MVRLMCAAMALAVVGGCAASGQQVRVDGETEDVVMLAGDWVGEYKGVDSGRQGTIKLSLGVGRHTASGHVLMYADGGKGKPRPLHIKFVRVDDGTVTGTMDPYTDPACDCTVETTFTGHVEGDIIDGTFETVLLRGEDRQRGHWSVYRQSGV